MYQYDVQISNQAEKDLYDILHYIEFGLQEPNIAKRFYKKVNEQISNLNINPKKYPIVDEIVIKRLELRKFSVNNYIIFYKVYDSDKIVYVLRILYAKRNWKEIL